MPLATGTILSEAVQNRYAVPAFSVHSVDMVDAIMEEAEAQHHPVMLQIGQRAIRNGQMEALAAHARSRAARLRVAAVIHLDHSHDYGQVVQAVRAGFTSCMIDASALPFEENVAATREVVRLCHAIGVPVEGEIGSIGGVEDDIAVADEDVLYTSVEAAVRFVRETSVDSLAVAIGSAHGMYKREPKLDLHRLAQIHEAVRIPLVLHGGSGIPVAQIRSAIRLGVAKVNFDTELRMAFVSGLQRGAESHPDDPFFAMRTAQDALRETVREKIGWCSTTEPH